MFYLHIGNVIIPTDELIFFRGIGLNHQPASQQNMAFSGQPATQQVLEDHLVTQHGDDAPKLQLG